MSTKTIGKNNARLPNLQPLLQAGIDPKTRLPMKALSPEVDGRQLFDGMNGLLTILDRQDFLGRYEWYNLPDGLDSATLERVLYYRGQGAFFFMPTNAQFYFLPYALAGNIDVYGKYLAITPLPFAGPSATTDAQGKQKPWIEGLVRVPAYDVLLPEELDEDSFGTLCVLLRDYSNDISQTIVPRAQLQKELIKAEAECLPRLRTALIGMSGVAAMRVTSEDEASNVGAASKSMDHASIAGDRLIPTIGSLDFQDLSSTQNAADVEQFSLAMQLMDNLRLSALGVSNGGLFQKQGTVLQQTQNATDMANGYVLMDGLKQRQHFCDVVNSIFGLMIWCEIAQPEIPVNNESAAPQGDGDDDGDDQGNGADRHGQQEDNKDDAQ